MDRTENSKALIVEDNESMTYLFSNYLDRMGLSYDSVKDGFAAIKKAREFEYHIVPKNSLPSQLNLKLLRRRFLDISRIDVFLLFA